MFTRRLRQNSPEIVVTSLEGMDELEKVVFSEEQISTEGGFLLKYWLEIVSMILGIVATIFILISKSERRNDYVRARIDTMVNSTRNIKWKITSLLSIHLAGITRTFLEKKK